VPNTIPIDEIEVEKIDRETGYLWRIVDTVKGTNDSIHSIITRVSDDLKRAKLADIIDDFETCILEAICNATRYAYGWDEEATVDFQYYRNDKQIKLSIRDFGAGFDYEAFKKTRIVTPEDTKKRDNKAYGVYGRQYPNIKGKFGLLLIEMFMDQVEYENNTLLMIKKLEPKPNPDNS